MSTPTTKLTVFLDNIGRTIIATVVTETDDTLVVQNPATTQLVEVPGQMKIQILPLFFREFLANPNKPTQWVYQKKTITPLLDTDFDFKLHAQYEAIFRDIAPAPQPVAIAPAPQPVAAEPQVIKFFEE